MEFALRKSLNSIFAKHENARPVDQDAATLEDKINQRLAAFRDLRETKYRPVMEAVGSYLVTKGFEHEIVVFEADEAAAPRDRESRVCFHVIEPPLTLDAREYPGLSVVCDPFSNTVRFRMNQTWSGVGAGFAPTGAMTIEEADLGAFQNQMLAFLAAAFR